MNFKKKELVFIFCAVFSIIACSGFKIKGNNATVNSDSIQKPKNYDSTGIIDNARKLLNARLDSRETVDRLKSIYNDFDFHVIRFSPNIEEKNRVSCQINYSNTDCGAIYFDRHQLNNWVGAVVAWCFVGAQLNDGQIILRRNENNVGKAVQTTLDVNPEKQFRYVCAIDHGHGDWYPDEKGNTYMKWQDFGVWFNMYASLHKSK